MKQTKAIAYAFPSSPLAKEAGMQETGCYYIELGLIDVEGSGQSNFSPCNQAGFFEKIDQDLLDSFEEAEGQPCQLSLKYNPHFYNL